MYLACSSCALQIDSQSGTLAADEKDHKTAFSYFFEAFEQFSALSDSKAVPMLKYMLLCKIMMNDVSPHSIFNHYSVEYISEPQVCCYRTFLFQSSDHDGAAPKGLVPC